MALSLPQLLHHLLPLADHPDADAALLERFARQRDEAAFTALVARHGPLVLRVCRRLVSDPHTAEDAFQAVFLVLAQKACSIRCPGSLAAWLHGVAYRLALKARSAGRTSRSEPSPDHAPVDPRPDPLAQLTARELVAAVDEEVQALPEAYRLPVILCCLEGRTQEEAARVLGWAPGSVKGRLERGRKCLQAALLRRGLTLATALTAVEVSRSVAAPPLLVEKTVRAILLLKGPLSARALALAGAYTGEMAVRRFRMMIAALLLLAGTVAAGVGTLARQPLPSKAAGAGPQKGTPKAKSDLPPGALARFGTAQLRALCDSLTFSADGKALVDVNGSGLIRVWGSATGHLQETRRLPRRPGRNRWAVRGTRSTDGNTLLLCEGAALELWDVPSGKRLGLPLPTGRKRLDRFALSDDRRLLLLAEIEKERFVQGPLTGGSLGRFEQQQNLLLWDTKTAKLRVLATEESQLVGLAIAPDGKRLASSSYGKGTRIWDAVSGKLLWQEPRFNAEQVAFTPDSKHLIAAPGGGQNRWHIWDAATGQPAKALLPPTIRYVWAFALSPDGSKLIAPTETDYVLWDLRAGKALHRWPGANQAGKGIFSPDGRSVVTYLTTLQRWDVATGKPLFADVSALGHTAAVRRLFFTPEGKRLVSVAEDGTIRIWDVADTRLRHTAQLGPVPIDSWALTPDGSTLVGVDERLTVRQWSVAKGRSGPSHELRAAKNLDIRLRARHVRVAPDGKTLAVAGWPHLPEYSFRKHSFSFWDLQTGRLRHWGGDPGRGYRGDPAALAPDGRFAAAQGELYDTLSGQRRFSLPMDEGHRSASPHVFSADGRLLAAQAKKMRVWETATGQTIIDLPEANTRQAALSPTGRLFACADARRLVVYDLSTAKAVLERTGEELRAADYWVTSIAFVPDGRALATGHADGTILLWGLPPAARRLADVAALWDDLAGEAVRGQAAVWRMQDDPQAAVRFLRKHIVVVPPPSSAELKRLIADLDSERFETREAATRRLRALGRAAEPALREAVKARPPLEQRRRLEALLEALPQLPPPRGDDLRAVRAVAILEGCKTAEARQLLRVWARGLPGAWLTDEAKVALERLGRLAR